MPRRRIVWGVTAICVALGFMLSAQISSRPSYSGQSTSYIDLRTQVQEAAQEHQLLEDDISKARAQLDEYQAAGGSSSRLQQVLKGDEKSVEQEAGITPVSGPGIVITIQDAPTSVADPQAVATFQSEADQFIAEIVNDLFGNGATAISVNGHRLVTTSSIRMVSGLSGIGAVHVNGHPIAEPYVISAVGNIADMKAALTVNQLAELYPIMGESYQVATFSGAKGVKVPGYVGPLPGQYAKEGSGS
ncbi:DUF881 domain-containing protein [Alicyclobacillus fodiniaquatilis]|uniref:DUF881 domain-containing protein n=1 Tax=Alicyclobacillus fodiniaquatilis TaxID=1661150 RepID=A0ABW4JMJ3_9BACL